MVKGQKTIKVIQGDSYQLNVSVENVTNAIDHITISSEKLGIKKALTYDSENNKYVFTLSPDETKDLKVGKDDYDLTIFFTDENVLTIVYRCEIVIYEKTNPAL